MERESQDVRLEERISVLRAKQKTRISVPDKLLDHPRDGRMQVNVPNPVLSFKKRLNASVPYLLPDEQSRASIGKVLIDFDSESLANSHSGCAEKNIEHLLSSF